MKKTCDSLTQWHRQLPSINTMVFKRTLYNSDVNDLIPNPFRKFIPMGILITLICYIRAMYQRQPGYFTVYISEIAANAISKCADNICNNEYLHI